MKKFLALILAMLLMMSMSVALADASTTNDDATVTITKNFTANNTTGVTPADTFTFSSITKITEDDVAGESGAAYPEVLPTFANNTLTFTEGQASQTATINLPTYKSVGVYTYKFNEIAGTTAGVNYYTEEMRLVVTVIEGQDGKLRVAAVHCEPTPVSGTYGTSPKTDVFTNTYDSGTLSVSKKVTGNLGDKSKYFDVTVTFTAASGETIKSTITYTGGQYTTPVTVENNTATIQVKDGDTVTFANVPEGVTYTVVEADYTKKTDGTKDYDTAAYEWSDSEKKIAADDADTCTITNNKTADIDTGITLETLPYVLMMVLALAGTALMIVRRRRSNED